MGPGLDRPAGKGVPDVDIISTSDINPQAIKTSPPVMVPESSAVV